MVKYVFVTGGVLSGLGKGVTSASIALLVKGLGYKVTAIKIDPYVNVDAGTMNPYMHGEVFVTEDGGETDLDIGHYERFLNVDLSKENNLTTGKVYSIVIERERRGDYLGQTVQIIPHVTDEIKNQLNLVASKYGSDVVVVEIGGTVGDIEGLPFLEAARQLRLERGAENVLFTHVVLVPKLSTLGELKTKPAQHSMQELRRIGIQPDILVARSPEPLTSDARAKLSLFGNLPPSNIFSNPDVEVIYEVPLQLHRQGLTKVIAERLRLTYVEPDLSPWIEYLERFRNPERRVRIAMVGKYTKLTDSYLSIVEALKHAGASLRVKPEFVWVEATDIERGVRDASEFTSSVDGAVILPGFGERGVEGKLRAIKAFREAGLPVFGICFGLQLMVVEFARNVLGLRDANTTEVNPQTPHPVVDLLSSQRGTIVKGGSMRLGSLEIRLIPGTLAWRIYGGANPIYERHRHRYQINPEYVDALEREGLIASGLSSEGFPEVMELRSRRFYLGVQFHPEFRSRPLRPSPIYASFLKELVH
ncbi:MAG: CTP synthase [Zestosphaera sp.]